MQLTDTGTPKHHRLFYGSSYDRGLEHLLFIWDDIKKSFPDTTLHIAYGWDTFDKMTVDNPERQEWKKGMQILMNQEGIYHHGRLSKDDLKLLRKHCGIWAYPSHFFEIFCITAIECQKDGLVPVTTKIGSLPEVVHSGSIIDVEITTQKGREVYLKELIKYLADKQLVENESKKAKKINEKYTIENVAQSWDTIIKQKSKYKKISVITPTIRRGFGNLMAHNLSIQTYKDFEWIIVDDYAENRQNYFEQLAQRYKLSIKYLRGKERAISRRFGLANANNTGYKAATGELIVILQDFILIPEDGLEQLAILHNRHPNALLAPVDVQAKSNVKEKVGTEDWYDENTQPVGEIHHKSIRITNMGLRESTNPFEFEQNYCAIPKHILDYLGGWYECMDEGLGYDNTEFAWRALESGFKLLVDELNIAICLDHWEPLKDNKKELGEGRERSLNDPRYLFLQEAISKGLLPMKVDQNINDSLDLKYEMPQNVVPKEWIHENMNTIATKWLQIYFNK